MPFKIEVRPLWLTQKPRSLELETISVKGKKVMAQVHYQSTKALEWKARGVDPPFYSTRSAGNSIEYHAPHTNYLIVNWSQHLETEDGVQHWFAHQTGKRPTQVVIVQSVQPMANQRYLITYDCSQLSWLHPGQKAKFKADIGIDGQGLIPIEATMIQPQK